jgi:lipoxygenase
MKYTININTAARNLLISSGGLAMNNTSIGTKFGEFIAMNYENMDIDKLDFPSRLESLGFHKTKDGVDKGALDEYPFGDDGALVWDAIYEFVGEYLRLYYNDDKDIMEGHPLHKNTFPKVETIDALEKFVTTIIWTTSCHHSVVNFNQFKVIGFFPNYPAFLFQRIPTTKEIIDEDFIVKSFPQLPALSIFLLTLNNISDYSKSEEYLLTNP